MDNSAAAITATPYPDIESDSRLYRGYRKIWYLMVSIGGLDKWGEGGAGSKDATEEPGDGIESWEL